MYFLKSKPITNETLQHWLINAEAVLEQDEHGAKVARLNQHEYLKIFRVKSFVSSANIFSYARRFCRNAERIRKLGIPTITVKQLYHIPKTGKSAVVYTPLPGISLLDLLHAKKMKKETAFTLGEFMAGLHDKGIYFRGLHLGNIVLTPDHKMGLIDIADMTIFPWRLDCRRRLKNFSRFWRTFEDKYKFGHEAIHTLIQGYATNCEKVKIRLKDIEKNLFILISLNVASRIFNEIALCLC